MLGLLPGCSSTAKTEYGIRAIHGPKTEDGWRRECEIAARHLGIPYEQHQGTFATEYAVGVINEPLGGLLCKRAIIWIIIGIPPAASQVRIVLEPHDGRAAGTCLHGAEFVPLAWALKETMQKFPGWPGDPEAGKALEASEHLEGLQSGRAVYNALAMWIAEQVGKLSKAVHEHQ